MNEPKRNELAIIGGGITGLTAALRAIEAGQDPASITVYETTQRLGGKIETAYLSDGSPVNKGAEFIDSDQIGLLNLCEQLGVKLTASADQSCELFQRMNGEIMRGTEFHSAFAPLARRILQDKQEVLANPTGERAQSINKLSLNDYLTSLRNSTPIIESPNLFQRVGMLLTGNSNRVSPEITTMAMQAFASEVGRAPEHANALQYLHEASSEMGSFLDSDCAYRVEGGTEKIIDALKAKLQERGVKFEYNARITHAIKQGNDIELAFADGKRAMANKTIFALPAYALGKIEGLQTLGLNPELQRFIGNTQYTKSVKFTVKLKDNVPMQMGNFFANHGMQTWNAKKGELTFLVNADKLERMDSKQLVEACLNSYARSQGMAVDALFDRSPGNIVFSNPGNNACYASPRPGEALQLEHVEKALGNMAEQGASIAGTYLPVKSKTSIGLGFMECGVVSAEHAVEKLIQPQKQRPEFLHKILTQSREQIAAISR